MTSLDLLILAVGAVVGTLATFVVCRTLSHRALAALQQRLQMSELARHAMQERSDQARQQIGQLSKSLADLQAQLKRVQPAVPPAPAQPSEFAAPAARDDHPLLMPRESGPPQAFADTEVM